MKYSSLVAVFVVTLSLTVSDLPLLAQENEQDVSVARRETAFEKSSAETARKAKAAAETELKAVSFEDILARPDDVALNFQYAREQVAKGNVLEAASTLQRILLVDPSLDPVRLFYAAVLFRLDNLTEASREIAILETRDLPAPLRAELKRFKDEIKKRKKKTRLNLRQSVGWGLDTNRNASPSSKKRLFSNTLVNVAPQDGARRDTNFLNVTNVDVSHELGFQAAHQLVGSFTYFLQEQTKADTLDLQSFQYDLGAVLKTPYFDVTPLFHASHVFLSHESFLRSQGGSVLIDKSIWGNRLRLYNLNHLEHQDFIDITGNTTSHQRRGNLYTLIQGASFAITPSMSLGFSVGYQHKEAKAEFNAYERLILETTHTWIWPKSQFIVNSLTGNFDEYNEPDLALAGRRRHDRMLRYRFTYGAPLSTLFFFADSVMPEMIKDINASFSYEYFRALSNYTNYTYHNNKLQVLLTKKWSF